MGHDSFDPLADIKISEGTIYMSDRDKTLYTMGTIEPIKISYEPFKLDKKQEQINTLIKVTSRLIEENKGLQDRLTICYTEIEVLKDKLEALNKTMDYAVDAITDIDHKTTDARIKIETLECTKADKT